MIVFQLLKALLYGILEGITEWLPVSSTGHIILLSELLPLDFSGICSSELASEFFEMFEVVIQLGAILAVLVMFFDELAPLTHSGLDRTRLSLWGRIAVACVPSAVVGIALQICFPKLLKGLYNWQTVSAMLIAYGLFFMVTDRLADKKEKRDAENISYASALAIGCFQALSIVPGTSRSGVEKSPRS